MTTVQEQAPILVTGADRSGTSLMFALLASHPRISMVRRTNLWRWFYGGFGDLSEPANLDRCLETMLRYKRLQQLEPSPERIRREFASGKPTYGRLFALLHVQNAMRSNKQRWGDKSLHTEHFADRVFAEFPEAKMIHMIRDPRDRYASISRRYQRRIGTHHRAHAVGGQQAFDGALLVDHSLFLAAVQRGHELMFRLERNRVQPRHPAVPLGVQQTPFVRRDNQRCFRRVALHLSPALLAQQHGVVAEETRAKTFGQGGFIGRGHRFASALNRAGRLVAGACHFINPAPGVNFLHARHVSGPGRPDRDPRIPIAQPATPSRRTRLSTHIRGVTPRRV